MTTTKRPDAVELTLDAVMAVRRLYHAVDNSPAAVDPAIRAAVDNIADRVHKLGDYVAKIGEDR